MSDETISVVPDCCSHAKKQILNFPMNSEILHRARKVPTIVSIVVAQLAKLRAVGKVTDFVFNSQLQRLAQEELESRALTLLVRDLPNGRTRFLVKDPATGTVCDMMEFERDGSRVTEECSAYAAA